MGRLWGDLFDAEADAVHVLKLGSEVFVEALEDIAEKVEFRFGFVASPLEWRAEMASPVLSEYLPGGVANLALEELAFREFSEGLGKMERKR